MSKPTTIKAAAPELPQEVARLRDALNCADAVSQQGFETIEAISNLMLMSLERPDGGYGLRKGFEPMHLNTLAGALNAVRYACNDFRESINRQADEHGCAYVDPKWEPRNGGQA